MVWAAISSARDKGPIAQANRPGVIRLGENQSFTIFASPCQRAPSAKALGQAPALGVRQREEQLRFRQKQRRPTWGRATTH